MTCPGGKEWLVLRRGPFVPQHALSFYSSRSLVFSWAHGHLKEP